MAEPESTTAIMLDQAEVDAAEAAAASNAAQENSGEDGEYIGRRPSSSGRDSKRYRKCCLLACCAPSHAPLYMAYSGQVHSCIHRAVIPPSTPNLSIFFLLRNQHESNAPHSSSRAVTFQQGLCNG